MTAVRWCCRVPAATYCDNRPCSRPISGQKATDLHGMFYSEARHPNPSGRQPRMNIGFAGRRLSRCWAYRQLGELIGVHHTRARQIHDDVPSGSLARNRAERAARAAAAPARRKRARRRRVPRKPSRSLSASGQPRRKSAFSCSDGCRFWLEYHALHQNSHTSRRCPGRRFGSPAVLAGRRSVAVTRLVGRASDLTTATTKHQHRQRRGGNQCGPVIAGSCWRNRRWAVHREVLCKVAVWVSWALMRTR